MPKNNPQAQARRERAAARAPKVDYSQAKGGDIKARIAELDARLGKGVGATRERARLQGYLDKLAQK